MVSECKAMSKHSLLLNKSKQIHLNEEGWMKTSPLNLKQHALNILKVISILCKTEKWKPES